MSALSHNDVPPLLRPIAHFIKIANEYSSRDVIIYYWCLLKALEDGMKLSGNDPNAKKFLLDLMTILEKLKQSHKDNDAIMQEIVAQSHIENQSQKLFQYAYSQDQQGQYNQKVVKAFYTCGYLFDVLSCFGQLDENIQSARKFAKWRATYIHSCLKRGEKPEPASQMSQQGKDDAENFEDQINDELSAELSRLNASIGETTKPHQNQPYTPHQADFGLPQVPSANCPNYGQSIGQFPSVGQFNSRQQPTAMGPATNIPKPGLQAGPVHPNLQQPEQHHGYSSHPISPLNPASANQLRGTNPTNPLSGNSAPQPAQGLTLDDYLEAKKYIKYANSALDYEDPKTSIDNMLKAIALLQKKQI